MLKIRFWVILLLLVLVSYGQILFMYVWQDDNALFFKLANIEGRAGYLGMGIFGQGAYKYTAAFYYPIYLIFGFATQPYFLLALMFYLLATWCVYWTTKKIFEERIGRIAGIVFASGYVASDGFIRLYNSVGTSLSIIFMSLMIWAHVFYLRRRNLLFYVLTVLFYWGAVEMVRYRTHYLIAIPIFVEVIYFSRKKILRNLINMSLRSLPLIYIFYRYFVLGADARSGQVGKYAVAILGGDYGQMTGFWKSLVNLVLPDWLGGWTEKVFWLVILLGLTVFWKLKGEVRKLYVVFGFLMIVNLGAYAAYQPMVVYETVNRLLAHSFYAYAVILGIIVSKWRRVGTAVACVVVIGNLYAGVNYQAKIVKYRSNKPRDFYNQLFSEVGKINKGDVFYFDVADSARRYYADAFSVAQMPETTAIAWRYGVDRYDFELFTDFGELKKYIEENGLGDNQLHAFFYDGDNLTNFSELILQYFDGELVKVASNLEARLMEDGAMEVAFSKPILSEVPVYVKALVRAVPSGVEEITFPYTKNGLSVNNSVYGDTDLKSQTFGYLREKERVMNGVLITTSSDWRERVVRNLADGDTGTVWQADRVLWQTDPAWLEFDFGREEVLSGVAWYEAFSTHVPTKNGMEIWRGKNWEEVKTKYSTWEVSQKKMGIISFEPVVAQKVRISFFTTVGGDSPALAEVWVLPGDGQTNVGWLEEYLVDPFLYMPSAKDYLETLGFTEYGGKIQYEWWSNKYGVWKTSDKSWFVTRYDGNWHEVIILIPPGGTETKAVRLSNFQIPGDVEMVVTEIGWAK